MKKIWVRGVVALVASATFSTTGFAQNASEVIGQPIQVVTNGVTNTVYLDAGGTARLITPNGTTLPATWTVASGQLCLNNGSASECWPYNSPFQANKPVTLTSSCNSTSTWTPQGTNAPSQGSKGERGR